MASVGPLLVPGRSKYVGTSTARFFTARFFTARFFKVLPSVNAAMTSNTACASSVVSGRVVRPSHSSVTRSVCYSAVGGHLTTHLLFASIKS